MSEVLPTRDSHIGPSVFPVTPWSVVILAGSGMSSDSSAPLEALEALCRAYWSPLYAFLRRADPELGRHDVEDLVQGYLARLIST